MMQINGVVFISCAVCLAAIWWNVLTYLLKGENDEGN